MKVIIIGGEAAGMSAAAKARRTNPAADIIVYEKSEIVSFGACGLPYYVGDFFSDETYMMARTPETFEKSGIAVRIAHEVTSVNSHDKTVTVKNLKTGDMFHDTYDTLLIATGASPIIPPVSGTNLGNVFTLTKMSDGEGLKRVAQKTTTQSVVVIGGGYIGVEVVEAMKHLGKDVTLIQLDERILPETFDADITGILQQEIISHNVNLRLGEKVTALEGEGTVSRVVTDKGTYEADVVVIATGIRPNTAFLKNTSMNMLDNGAIIIDEYGRTSVQDVYSAGDCATVYHLVRKENVYIPLATTANKIGRVVGENIVGKSVKFPGTLGSACLKVMDFEAGRTGIGEKEADKLGIPYKQILISDKNQTNYYPGQEDIHLKLIYHAETKVILGGQIVGRKGAVLRTDVLATAIYMGMTTEQLGMMDFCYSPPFARTWDVLNVGGNVAK